MSWEGPHKIGDYLCSVAHSPWKRPPERAGVYVVSEKPWRDVPTEADKVLYVGQAAYLRYQIGRLLGDLLGFTGDNPSSEEAYQHKGGHSVWAHYCLPRQIEPAKLYLGWCSECACIACAEAKLLEMMSTSLRRVKICGKHRPVLDLWQNCPPFDTDHAKFEYPQPEKSLSHKLSIAARRGVGFALLVTQMQCRRNVTVIFLLENCHVSVKHGAQVPQWR